MNLTKDLIQQSPQIPECKISYSLIGEVDTLPQVTSPEQAYKLLLEIWDKDTICYREEFIVLLLNNAKRVIGWSKISIGGSNATIVEPAMVFQVALLSHASSIILAHNHPSNNMRASTADINLTKRLKEAGQLLGISIDDHLIISSTTFISLRNESII